jgi:hypothetical protein
MACGGKLFSVLIFVSFIKKKKKPFPRRMSGPMIVI